MVFSHSFYSLSGRNKTRVANFNRQGRSEPHLCSTVAKTASLLMEKRRKVGECRIRANRVNPFMLG